MQQTTAIKPPHLLPSPSLTPPPEKDSSSPSLPPSPHQPGCLLLSLHISSLPLLLLHQKEVRMPPRIDFTALVFTSEARSPWMPFFSMVSCVLFPTDLDQWHPLLLISPN